MPVSPVEQALAKGLGVRVQQLRVAADLTQEQLAQAIGMSTNHVQLLENGLSDRRKGSPANPRFGTLVALSRALGVELPDLLRGVDTSSS